MGTNIENLKDLFIEQGRELYNTSIQEERELEEIKRRAENKELKDIIDKEIKYSALQKEKLHVAFIKMDIDPEGEGCETSEAILMQARDFMDRSRDSEVRDAAIINAVQRLNHNKITGLGSFRSYAEELGETEIADSFREFLRSEKEIDKNLSELAINRINKSAAVTKAH